MEKFFHLKENGTTVSTEILAGLTTFFAMAYIIVVNPQILSQTGMPWGGVFLATIIAAIIGTLVMGLFANVPYAQAAGMGLNAFFTYTVCFGLGFSWQQTMCMVFLCGLINILITVTKIRKMIILAIPESLQHAIGGGIGLFRSEFLYLNTTDYPTEDQQFEAYKQVLSDMDGKEVIIRTLDVGGDKEVSYLKMGSEQNPFLGWRAIRYCLSEQPLFKTQLRALLRAGAQERNIKIMLPLVTGVQEIRAARSLLEECKQELSREGLEYDPKIALGVMIETPAAALTADLMAKEADFFSIGTNDLTGYTMACDRGNNDVSYLYSPLQPSVLRMIKRTIECGVQNGISVGMCGEAAANKLMIPLLISFGLTEFSVSAPSVLNVRKIISTWTKEEADKVTAKVLEMSTQQEIVEYLKSVV